MEVVATEYKQKNGFRKNLFITEILTGPLVYLIQFTSMLR